MSKNRFGSINFVIPTNVSDIKGMNTKQKLIWVVLITCLGLLVYFAFKKSSFSKFESTPIDDSLTNVNILWNNGNNKLANSCLYVENGYSSNGQPGSKIKTGMCDANNQSFDPNYLFTFNSDNTISWANDGSMPGMCLAVNGGMDTNGVDNLGKLNKKGDPFLNLVNCDSSDPNQKFILDNNQLSWINDGTIQNQCISIPNGVQNLQTNLPTGLWPCNFNGVVSNNPNLSFKFNKPKLS